jgi:DNA polymerase-3 subunit epsilon
MMRHLITSFPLCFLDLETTGTGYHNGHRIVEVGVCRREPDGRTKGPFARRVNPERAIPMRASQIHKIYDLDVVDLPPFRERAKKLAEFCDGTLLVAHNAKGCDDPMLRAEFLAAGVPWPFIGTIDTLPVAQKVFRGGSCSLKPLAERLKVPLAEAHTAEGDVVMLMGIFDALVAALGDAAVLLTFNPLLEMRALGFQP